MGKPLSSTDRSRKKRETVYKDNAFALKKEQSL